MHQTQNISYVIRGASTIYNIEYFQFSYSDILAICFTLYPVETKMPYEMLEYEILGKAQDLRMPINCLAYYVQSVCLETSTDTLEVEQIYFIY